MRDKAVVRHPMYSGALLMFVFTPLAIGSFWDFIFAILIFTVIVWRLLDEEKFLTKNLPGYEAYCKKTPIPFNSRDLVIVNMASTVNLQDGLSLTQT